jgi:hypothetical protein
LCFVYATGFAELPVEPPRICAGGRRLNGRPLRPGRRCCLCRSWSGAARRRFAVVGVFAVCRSPIACCRLPVACRFAVAYCLLPVAECLSFDTLGKRDFALTPKMALFGLRMVVSDA